MNKPGEDGLEITWFRVWIPKWVKDPDSKINSSCPMLTSTLPFQIKQKHKYVAINVKDTNTKGLKSARIEIPHRVCHFLDFSKTDF